MASVKRKKSGLLIKLILLAFIIYFLCVSINLWGKINDKQAEVDDLDIQISNKTSEKERLTDILEAEFDEEYAQKVARELGYVNPDEKVYEGITD